MVGRLDARVTGPMAASRTREWEFDPGIETIAPPTPWPRSAYLGRELGLATTQRYEILSMEVHEQWNWNRGKEKGNSYASTSGDLARAMRRNPHLKVLVASGHYDLGTPYSASTGRWPRSTRRPRCWRDRASLLRRRAHDVHARGRPGEA